MNRQDAKNAKRDKGKAPTIGLFGDKNQIRPGF